MKQEIKTFMFAIALSMTCGMVMAQGYQNGGNRPSREQMVEKQANSIAQQLGLNGNKPMGRPQMSDEDKKKVETLKQKYNKKYAKFLSQDQITKVYQLQEQERAKRHPQAKQN